MEATKEAMRVGGTFHLDCFKDEADRQLWLKTKDKSLVLWHADVKNKIPDQGLTNLGNVYFFTTAKLTNEWYLTLTTGAATAWANTMTYATPVYTESVAFAARPVCAFATSASNINSNTASVAVFTNTGTTETIYGVCLVGANAAGVTTPGDKVASGGVLFSYGLLSPAQPWISGNVINLTYSVTSATA
jgi:hypothetical protein